MLQKQGICPICGSDELEYDGLELQGEQTGFPWKCLNCGAEGTEWYEMQFVMHDDIVENNGFPSFEEIKKDYHDLMNIIKDIRTIEQIKRVEKEYNFTIEINGMTIDKFLKPDINGYVCTDKDIEWVRYELYGCLSFIYDRFDGKPTFDVYSSYCDGEFITEITIDELTEDLYKDSVGYFYKKFNSKY